MNTLQITKKTLKNITLFIYLQLRFEIYPMNQSQNIINVQGLISPYRIEKILKKSKRSFTDD